MGQGTANAAKIIEKAALGYINGVTSRGAVALRKQKEQNELAKEKYTSSTEAMQQEIDLLNQQNQESSRKLDKSATFNALRMYKADSNPRHINRLLKDNPRISEALGVTEIGRLDPYSPEDAMLISQSGGDAEDFKPVGILEGSEEAELLRNRSSRYIKSRLANGEWKVTDMQNVYSGTGFTQFIDDQELKQLMLKSKVAKSSGKGGSGTAMMQNAAAVSAAKQRIEAGKGSPGDEELVRFGTQKVAGVKPGQADVTEDSGTQLTESFGGEEKFYKTDFGDKDNFNKAWPAVQRMMHVGGEEFTAKDRVAIHDIRALLALGEPGGDLTDAETGIIDNVLSNFKKYLSDEVSGLEAKSAYAAFRNSVRHALYGAALTEAEIESFDQAFGTLGQKLGPVLAQFKTSLSQVKAKLDSIASLGDPRVAKVMLGADQERLDRMLVALDERIMYMSGKTDKPGGSRVSLRDRLKAKVESRSER